MGSAQRSDLAAAVWRKLFDFIIRTRAHRDRALEKRGLTPNDSRALFTLGGEPHTMRELARLWVCDPSNATWVIDRLEKAGLAERRHDPADRRVTRVALTKKGEKTKMALEQELYQPPPELLELERADLERLLDAASKLS